MVALTFDQAIRSDTAITEIQDDLLQKAGVVLSIKREDQNHPYLSGNKAYKLKYNLIEAERQGHKRIITFGGAYSNHIRATAAAGQLFGFETVGVIRGEQHLPLNPTLRTASGMGMHLHYMDRSTYRQKHQKKVLDQLTEQYGDAYIIPEGGTNLMALPGCKEWAERLPTHFDWIITPCGTGGSLAGLALGLPASTHLLGISVLKGASFLNRDISELIGQKHVCTWSLSLDYHFGGYAKSNPELASFIKSFEKKHEIPLEFVYSGKMIFAVVDLIKKGFFSKGSKILALHTGGLRLNE